MPYAVAFENKPDATAPAQQVVVTDQVDRNKFNLATFGLGPIAFGNKRVVPPPGLSQYSTDVDLRPATNLIVRINVGLDTTTGLATWRFTSLDPATMLPTADPLAGFLPPDTSPPQGEGSILFTVMPRPGLADGTQIQNQATVVFDQNAPINTPTWLNTIDATQPVISRDTSQDSCSLPGNNGWCRGIQTAGFTASDATSGVAGPCTAGPGAACSFTQPATTEGSAVTIPSGPVTNGAGNTNPGIAAGPFKIDATPPAISPISGFNPDGQQGWFTTGPAVGTVSATDDISGVASVDCTDDLNGLTVTGSSGSRTLAVAGDGVHHLSCTATDLAGNTSAPATLTVKIDTTRPTCTAVATPQSLWPPNHQLVSVTVSLTAGTGASGLQSIIGPQPTSNEDNAAIASNVQGLSVYLTYTPTSPDSTGPPSYMGTASGQIRAERDGNGSGRIYSLTYTVTNMAGTVAACTATVTVPHDQGG